MSSHESRIFVSIASYRDPEIVKTLKDLYAKAIGPQLLDVVVCLQEEPEKANILLDFEKKYNLRVLYVDAKTSQGCCWARAQINKCYAGQEFALQIDSHHRFIEQWDSIAKEMLAECETQSEKPILTSYLPPYSPEMEESEFPKHPCKIMALSFTQTDTVAFAPCYFDHKQRERVERTKRPQRTAFFSGHFCFSRGKIVTQVPYDEELYFAGEEDTMAVRLFTHGWDLFCMNRVLAWHYYSREKRPKHWEDHKGWWRKNRRALMRVSKLLNGSDKQGLGTERTLDDYWRFSGINHRERTIECWAMHGYTREDVVDAKQQEQRAKSNLWVHSQGCFERKGKRVWQEKKLISGGYMNVCEFEEEKGEQTSVKLFDKTRDFHLRLTGNTCDALLSQNWIRLYNGCWIQRKASIDNGRRKQQQEEEQDDDNQLSISPPKQKPTPISLDYNFPEIELD